MIGKTQRLGEQLVAEGAITEAQAPELFGEILAREEEATTGIGKGIAMPHARRSEVVEQTLLAVGLHPDGIDFDAVQQPGLGSGLVDVKVCAVDDDWSGLKFMFRKKDSTSNET